MELARQGDSANGKVTTGVSCAACLESPSCRAKYIEVVNRTATAYEGAVLRALAEKYHAQIGKKWQRPPPKNTPFADRRGLSVAPEDHSGSDPRPCELRRPSSPTGPSRMTHGCGRRVTAVLATVTGSPDADPRARIGGDDARAICAADRGLTLDAAATPELAKLTTTAPTATPRRAQPLAAACNARERSLSRPARPPRAAADWGMCSRVYESRHRPARRRWLRTRRPFLPAERQVGDGDVGCRCGQHRANNPPGGAQTGAAPLTGAGRRYGGGAAPFVPGEAWQAQPSECPNATAAPRQIERLAQISWALLRRKAVGATVEIGARSSALPKARGASVAGRAR